VSRSVDVISPAELKGRISRDSDPSVRAIGELFLGLGLEPLAHAKRIPDVGEIDLAFLLQRDGFLFVFLIEVSADSYDQNQKIDHFFSRWSNQRNLDLILREIHMTGAKNLRLYIDMSRDSKNSDISSVKHHFGKPESPNQVMFKDDVEYFQGVSRSIGKWAKSDLLSFLRVPISRTSLKVNAIQFYLDDIPAFCFVCDVRTLLDSCYISRRLEDRRGYQRALNQDRLRNIEKDIEDRKIVAFPNSILVNCEDVLASPLAPPHDCPKSIEVTLPTSYCSCCVVDGQHRLLGFSRLDEAELSQRHLPVVAFQKLPLNDEVKLFIDINSKQKRIDSNLIEDLRADFHWDRNQNYREHTGRVIVLIARELDKKGPLRARIFFGGAREAKQGKITLTTFVSVLRENQLIGGKKHFWQSDPTSEDCKEPLEKTKNFFSSMLKVFHADSDAGRFLLGNIGLRIIFRTIQVLERNSRAGTTSIENARFLQDLHDILNTKVIAELETLYGGGGGLKGSNRIVETLQERFPTRYEQIEVDFRRLAGLNVGVLTPISSEKST
jgi:DGQHR domain-containing protein